MVSNSRNSWAVAGTSFALWGLVAVSAVYWGLKLAQTSRVGAANPLVVSNVPPIDPTAVGRLLGAVPNTAAVAPPLPSLASRFALLGVVASRSHEGAALISMDGKPAKPFRVGTTVDEGLILQSVESRRAILAASADGPPIVTLELPAMRK